jgi:hypothetical protein
MVENSCRHQVAVQTEQETKMPKKDINVVLKDHSERLMAI